MSSKQISPLLRSWYKWKTLRLPWRKKFLVGELPSPPLQTAQTPTLTNPPSPHKGLDLQGNTYWEFRDERHGPADLARWRRIVQYPRATHYGEVQVSPQWHQWLRHMRERPPTVQEQHAEVRRQAQMKGLAAAADARWEAKPRVMEAPRAEEEAARLAQPGPLLESRGRGGSETREGEDSRRDAIAGAEEQVQGGEEKPRVKEAVREDPWKKQQRGGPSESWQPQSWAPPASKR